MYKSIENAPASFDFLHSTVEEKAAFWIEYEKTLSADYDGDIYGLPTDDVITEEQAIFLAYAAVEDKYGYDENILCSLYPDMTYEISNASAPRWRAALVAHDDEVHYTYGSFYVDIDAKTGTVLNCRGPEDAVG